MNKPHIRFYSNIGRGRWVLVAPGKTLAVPGRSIREITKVLQEHGHLNAEECYAFGVAIPWNNRMERRAA